MDSFSRPAQGARTTGLDQRPARLIAALLTAAVLAPAALFAQETPSNAVHAAAAPSAVATEQDPDGFLFTPPIVRIGMRAGFNFARASSGVFDLATDELTLDRGDFGGFAIGGDLALRLAEPVDLVFSVTHMSSSTRSEFRDWDEDGVPITQRTKFGQTPLTAAARVYLTSRGRQIGQFAWVPAKFSPYVGAGGGAIHYQFEQSGSFVDFVDLSIFDATLESSGWAPVGLVNAGADITLNPRVTLNTDLRYQFASAEMAGSFIDITDDIDLNGLQLSLGVHFRF
jgi:hypothetical protein